MSWLKIETHTPDKPEIFAMAEMLGLSTDEVFAKCFRVWVWFDAHTTDGKSNAVSVTQALLERYVSVTGFAEAMLKVGWLSGTLDNLSVPNFERHNGESAKKRALTAKRAQKYRNANSVTNVTQTALPDKSRQDKKREEVNKGVNKASAKKRSISQETRDWAKENGISHLDDRLQYFLSYVKAHGKHYADLREAFKLSCKQDWAKLNNVRELPPTNPVCLVCGGTASRTVSGQSFCSAHDKYDLEAA